MNDPIVFIDGYCVLCDRFANFILKRDKYKKIKIATLQGETFKRIKSDFQEPLPDSVILMVDGTFYLKSYAVIRILKLLPFPYKLSVFLLLIPQVLRDNLYDWMAERRFRVFGKRESCRLPEPDEMNRFLN